MNILYNQFTMWTKIGRYDNLISIDTGDFISPEPWNSSVQYEIKAIAQGKIQAVSITSKKECLVIPIGQLLVDKWYVLMNESNTG